MNIHPQLLNFVRPSDHSTFSPSSADRWIACPYSIQATVGIPNESSAKADEGTLGHSVVEAYFYERIGIKPFPVELKMKMLTETKDGGAEMMEGAKFYFDTIIHWLQNGNLGQILFYGLEQGVPVFPEKGAFGTGDCLIIGTLGAVVIDYKYGSKPVKADTFQLRVYAAGIRRYLIDIPEDYRFHAVIVQPRTDVAPKEHCYTVAEMDETLNTVWNAIVESEKPDLKPVRGANHCFWCPANKTKDPTKKCKAITQEREEVLKEDFNGLLADMSAPVANLSDPNSRRDNALLKVMTMLPLLKNIADDAEAEFMYRISLGESIPGLSIVDKAGKRTWMYSEGETAQYLQQWFPGIDPFTDKLRGLTDIEKEVGKGRIDSLTIRKISKKISVHTEKQKEVLGELAAFGNLYINQDENEDDN